MNAKKIELAYLTGSHESTQFDADYWNMPTEDNLDFVGEFETIEEAMAAADDMGIGVYFVGDADGGHYDGAIRVVNGSKPEYHELLACDN